MSPLAILPAYIEILCGGSTLRSYSLTVAGRSVPGARLGNRQYALPTFYCGTYRPSNKKFFRTSDDATVSQTHTLSDRFSDPKSIGEGILRILSCRPSQLTRKRSVGQSIARQSTWTEVTESIVVSELMRNCDLTT